MQKTLRKATDRAAAALASEVDTAAGYVADEGEKLRAEIREAAITIAIGFTLAGTAIALAVLLAARERNESNHAGRR